MFGSYSLIKNTHLISTLKGGTAMSTELQARIESLQHRLEQLRGYL